MKRGAAFAGPIAPLAVLLICVGFAPAARAAIVLKDSFPSGSFQPNASDPTARYGYFFHPSNISIKTTYANGLHQEVNPFSFTMSQGPFGALDHAKLVVLSNKPLAPGPDKQVLRYTLNVGVQTYGTEKHPFGSAVTKPNDDLRLSSCNLLMADLATSQIAGFFVTNQGVYAYNERLTFSRTATDNYHAFTQVKRVASRKPSDMHTLTTEYNRKAGVINWYLGKKKVLSVSKIGMPTKETNGNGLRRMIDYGGEDKVISPASFSVGWACFTILDATDYWNKSSTKGLVKLTLGGSTYTLPASWADAAAEEKSRMFGQGAKIHVKDLKVEAL